MEPEETSAAESESSTGLPWPKTWNGAYILVLGTFIIYVALLIALTRLFS